MDEGKKLGICEIRLLTALSLCLLISASTGGCYETEEESADSQCMHSLRAALPLWHAQVQAELEAAQAKQAEGSDSSTALQMSIHASAAVAAAYSRYRIFGGETTRNEQNEKDTILYRKLALEASQAALKTASQPSPQLQEAVQALARNCP